MPKREQVYPAIAKSLVEFGYPDVTAEMIREIHLAKIDGKSGDDLPHGVIGMFAESQLDEAVKMKLLST